MGAIGVLEYALKVEPGWTDFSRRYLNAYRDLLKKKGDKLLSCKTGSLQQCPFKSETNPGCSGTLVGPNLILTAAHCISEIFMYYDTAANAHKLSKKKLSEANLVLAGTYSASKLIFWPGVVRDAQSLGAPRFGGRPNYATFSVSNVRRPRNWKSTRNSDYALVILGRSFSQPSEFLPLQRRAAAELSGKVLSIAGYPGEKAAFTQFVDSGEVSNVRDDERIEYRIHTTGGNSGGPVWMKGASERYLNAIHVGGLARAGYGIGVRIHCQMVRDLLSWCRAANVAPPKITAGTLRECGQ